MHENRILSDKLQFQVLRKCQSNEHKIDKVQAFINNISFPKTLNELLFFANEHGCFNVEDILNDRTTTWTVPRWAKIGDIVFFMHSKTAKSTITKLRTELIENKAKKTEKDYNLLMEWINRGLDLYQKYGGKIYALGRVCGAPDYYYDEDYDLEEASLYHWGSRIYADIEVDVLENPIDISEFNSFIKVSRQSGITGVFGKEYYQLRDLIKSKNSIPLYFENSESTPLPLTKINSNSWINITCEYRRCFMLESQFRSYFVDYLLQELGDQKTIYQECRCIKSGMADSFVDNIILFNGKYLPVEVKLSVRAEPNIIQQVTKYCNDDSIILNEKTKRIPNKNDIYLNNVLIIDTDNIYMFSAKTNQINIVYDLNKLTMLSNIEEIKSIVNSAIS